MSENKIQPKESAEDWHKLKECLGESHDALEKTQQKFQQIQAAKQAVAARGGGSGGTMMFSQDKAKKGDDENFRKILKSVEDASGGVDQLQQLARKFGPKLAETAAVGLGRGSSSADREKDQSG